MLNLYVRHAELVSASHTVYRHAELDSVSHPIKFNSPCLFERSREIFQFKIQLPCHFNQSREIFILRVVLFHRHLVIKLDLIQLRNL